MDMGVQSINPAPTSTKLKLYYGTHSSALCHFLSFFPSNVDMVEVVRKRMLFSNCVVWACF